MEGKQRTALADFPSDIMGKVRALASRMQELVAQTSRMERRIGEQQSEIKDLRSRLHVAEETRAEVRKRLQNLVGELPGR